MLVAPPPFGDVLRAALKTAKMSRNAFAKTVRVHPMFMAKVSAGERAVPKRSLERWADELALTGSARQEFIDAARWTQLTPELRTWVLAYWSRTR